MATCVWCGWLHPHCHHLHPLFSLSLPPFGIVIWVIIDMVVVVPVWLWCGVVCCGDVYVSHLKIFFLQKLFQPALNSSHDIGCNQCFLTSTCIPTQATTNTNGEWPPSPLFPTPMPGMKAGVGDVDGWTGGLEMCLCLEPHVSSSF